MRKRLSDRDLEKLVIEQFALTEHEGLVVKRDVELTLARRVAVRLRQVYEERKPRDPSL